MLFWCIFWIPVIGIPSMAVIVVAPFVGPPSSKTSNPLLVFPHSRPVQVLHKVGHVF